MPFPKIWSAKFGWRRGLVAEVPLFVHPETSSAAKSPSVSALPHDTDTPPGTAAAAAAAALLLPRQRG